MMHSLWCLYNTVMPMTMWNNFSFAVSFPKILWGKKYLRKWILFFKSINQLLWIDCVSACAGGAPSMIGIKKGFISFVKKKNNDTLIVHCYLHREKQKKRFKKTWP